MQLSKTATRRCTCFVASIIAVACASFLLTTVPDFIVTESAHPRFLTSANERARSTTDAAASVAVAASSSRKFRTCRVDRGEAEVSREAATNDATAAGDSPIRGALVMLRPPLLRRQDRPNHWYHFAQVFILYLAPLRRQR